VKAVRPGPVALRYLSYRDRTKKEVTKHLAKKGFLPGEVQATVEALARQGYLNDERFALHFGRTRMEVKHFGRRRLAMEMKKRGLEEDTILRALDALAEEVDEWDLALKAGKKKLSTLGGLDADKQRRRLAHHLERRGFATDTVYKVVHKLAPYRGAPPDAD